MTNSDDRIEKIIEELFHIGVMTLSSKIGEESHKSLVKATENKDRLSMILSALGIGVSAYGFNWASRKLQKVKVSDRHSRVLDLTRDKSSWYFKK